MPLILVITKSENSGAQTSVNCCLRPWNCFVSGRYYEDAQLSRAHLVSHWEQDALKLWEISSEQCREYLPGKRRY